MGGFYWAALSLAFWGWVAVWVTACTALLDPQYWTSGVLFPLAACTGTGALGLLFRAAGRQLGRPGQPLRVEAARAAALCLPLAPITPIAAALFGSGPGVGGSPMLVVSPEWAAGLTLLGFVYAGVLFVRLQVPPAYEPGLEALGTSGR